MTTGLKEALARRARQWQAFHKWEHDRIDAGLSIEERVGWYSAAFDFVRRLPQKIPIRDIAEKAAQIKNLRARLKYLTHHGDV